MNVLDNSWLAQNDKHDQYIWSKGWIREELKSSPVERFRPDKFSWPVFRACFRIVGWTPFSSVGFWKAAFLFAKGFLPLVAISLPHTFYNFTHRRAFVERCFRRPKKNWYQFVQILSGTYDKQRHKKQNVIILCIRPILYVPGINKKKS